MTVQTIAKAVRRYAHFSCHNMRYISKTPELRFATSGITFKDNGPVTTFNESLADRQVARGLDPVHFLTVAQERRSNSMCQLSYFIPDILASVSLGLFASTHGTFQCVRLAPRSLWFGHLFPHRTMCCFQHVLF